MDSSPLTIMDEALQVLAIVGSPNATVAAGNAAAAADAQMRRVLMLTFTAGALAVVGIVVALLSCSPITAKPALRARLISSGLVVLSELLVSPLFMDVPRWLTPMGFFAGACSFVDYFIVMQAVIASLGTAVVGFAWPSSDDLPGAATRTFADGAQLVAAVEAALDAGEAELEAGGGPPGTSGAETGAVWGLPDGVLVDGSMPVLGGVDAIRAIVALGKARAPWWEPRLWLVTGDVTAEGEAEALRAGADGMLRKPVTGERLVSSLLGAAG
ncbi:hypothetical protein FNF27_05180 [Cafeteria roenbergensis]|uniref:Response regulatory domain-containing protein n=1 Tax=Cafeteria roenbergensis TaxID=33653 RepID=A0A5A8E6K1_CAFRO|nr:hypothetical protein FNF27_05180 [Cafeteria roenbergensis]